MNPSMKIGCIGLGIMGNPMAQNLLKAGHLLFIYNRTPAKAENLIRQGAIFCPHPSAVAQKSDVVFINVTDTPDVENVLFGKNGVASVPKPGLIVIDNSTISPAAAQTFAARLKQVGIDFLDAPVSGGDVGARQGTLAVMVGGEKNVFEKCRPLLEILGKNVVHLGPAGMGQTCKAINQLFCALHMVACCEGIELARQTGLDPLQMLDIVSRGAGGSWALQNLGPKIIQKDFAPGFMIDLLAKDLRFTLELARQADLPLMGASLAQHLFHEAREQGLGRLGTQALHQVIQKKTKKEGII